MLPLILNRMKKKKESIQEKEHNHVQRSKFYDNFHIV